MLVESPGTVNASVRLLYESEDRELWDRLVDSSLFPDVYYRPGYAKAHEAAGHGTVAALVVDVGVGRALLPVHLRPISELDPDASDGMTPYGYGGLLLADGLKELNASQARLLVDHIRSWGRNAGLISLLVRLHPMLKQAEWLDAAVDDTCRLHRSRLTVALRTCDWSEPMQCISTLGKGRRSDLGAARRELNVTWMSQRMKRDEDFRIFYDLYEARMGQMNAQSFYHFPKAYYSVLAEELKGQLDIAIAWLGQRPVGASLFMRDEQFGHYHLSATDELGRAHKASTLLINEAVNWARERGCEYLHLGGGADGEDGLFEFKKSFGGEIFQYSFMTLIPDPERYQSLLQQRLADSRLPPLRPDFFPQYRA